MDEGELAEPMLISLAVAGQSGTLVDRMRGTAAQGRCRAKTGTINGVSNLAGYLPLALRRPHRLRDPDVQHQRLERPSAPEQDGGGAGALSPVNRRTPSRSGRLTRHAPHPRPRHLLLLVLAAPAAARDIVVRSFDGTELHVSFHPAKEGKRAPTILMTHGWGGKRERSPDGASNAANVGTAALRKAGFNVLTWDSRGFGDSGGTVTIDYRKNEGRDVRVLLDWLARQPEAKLDRKRDPRVGMHGGSYAGGIQFVAAAIDRRIDAIAPSIAWHSLLRPRSTATETIKGGWSALLYAAGQTGRLDPHITSAFGERSDDRHAVGRGPRRGSCRAGRARWSSASRCRR